MRAVRAAALAALMATSRGVGLRGPVPARAGHHARASPSDAWVQDRFAISFFIDPLVPPAEFDKRYAEVAGANFTLLINGGGASSPASVAAQLAACHKHDLKLITTTCGGPWNCGDTAPNATWASSKAIGTIFNASTDTCRGTSADSPLSDALWGWDLRDEPSTQCFPYLANWTASLRSQYPTKMSFINLLPSTSPGYGPGPAVSCHDIAATVSELHSSQDGSDIVVDRATPRPATPAARPATSATSSATRPTSSSSSPSSSRRSCASIIIQASAFAPR